MPGALILINGFPAVGKHAVALELVKLLPNCRFFDTRNLVVAASQLYESHNAAHGLLRKNLVSVEHAIFDSIARQYAVLSPTGPPPPTYVLTDFLSVGARATDLAIMHEFIAFAQRSGFAFIHIILSCTQEENIARMLDPARVAERERWEVQCGAGSGVGGGGDTDSCWPISTDTDALIALRMEEEIGHMAPVAGLCGEFEIDTTRMDARTAAGVLAEYCLDTLRNQGWWIHLSSVPKPAGVIFAGKK